jgi:predicted nuclease of predicted toxin-antitoxin system
MKVRFQADADLNQIILLATLRREPSIDFQTALAAGLTSLSDREVLAMAASEGRVLVTHDRKTMPRHFSEFIATQTSPGLVVIPQQLPLAAAVEDLILIWSATEADEWLNRICFLPL